MSDDQSAVMISSMKVTATRGVPMKVTIDKHGNTYASRQHGGSGTPTRLWVIHPADFREVERIVLQRDEYNYFIEVRNDGPEERITRVISNDVGEMGEVLSDEEFEAYAGRIIEHEDWELEEAREHMSENLHIMSESELRALGGTPAIFEALEDAWKAINHFVAFGVTF